MRILIHGLLLFTALLVATTVRAQSDRKELAEVTGSISGRVTLDGKAAAGVKVIAFKRERFYQKEPVATARTDESGHYQLIKLPSDHYYIMPIAPAYVSSGEAEQGLSGRAVALADGETIDSLDLSLTRGGVITGRITTANGQPVSDERIMLIQLGPKGEKRPLYDLPANDFGTDDRGIYRIFGLPPGRYLVSVGRETERGGSNVGGGDYFLRTFYPGVTDESKAGPVEVKAGAEATGIDIAFGLPKKSYSVRGRVVDAKTGKPIANAQLGYGMAPESNGGRGGYFSSGGHQTDDRGSFRFDGFLPGTFYIMALFGPESDTYSSIASFQIQDQDVAGLEIKVHRGSSISGALVVEGAGEPGTIAMLSRLELSASVTSPDIIRGADNRSKKAAISPDGAFQITGLRPGKAFLYIGGPDSKNFIISRVERGGAEQPQGIEVGPGEQVGGVRVVLGYASGRVRGQVKLEGGKLPDNAEMLVSLWRVDGPSSQSTPHVEVDPNGRFVVENLVAGEYEVRIAIYARDGASTSLLAPYVKKRVSVANGTESEVTFVIELTEKNKDRK